MYFDAGLGHLTAGRPHRPNSSHLLQCHRHLLVVQGFEEDIMSVLRKRYPPRLMEDLKGFSHEAIEDLVEAFPDKVIARSAHLHRFLQARPNALVYRHCDLKARVVNSGCRDAAIGTR